MRTLSYFLVLIVTILSFTVVKAGDGKIFGKGISLSDTTKISTILEKPDQFVGKTVLVKGRIVDVCKKRGCWIEIASDKEFQTIRFKVKDGEIVFPVSERGKMALVEGVFEKFQLTREQTIKQLQHKAEEEGKEFDASSVKEGSVYYQIRGIGAEILE